MEYINKITLILCVLFGLLNCGPTAFVSRDAGQNPQSLDAGMTLDGGDRGDAGLGYIPMLPVLKWFAPPGTGTRVDFGDVMVGTSSTRQITFTNEDVSPIQLTGLTAVNNQFEVVGATSVTLAAAVVNSTTGTVTVGTASVSVRFSPSVVGSKLGSLRATSSVSAQPSIAIDLGGVGKN
jgi:hypothetical protein